MDTDADSGGSTIALSGLCPGELKNYLYEKGIITKNTCKIAMNIKFTCTNTVKNITIKVVVRKCPFGKFCLSKTSTREKATAPRNPPYALKGNKH